MTDAEKLARLISTAVDGRMRVCEALIAARDALWAEARGEATAATQGREMLARIAALLKEAE